MGHWTDHEPGPRLEQEREPSAAQADRPATAMAGGAAPPHLQRLIQRKIQRRAERRREADAQGKQDQAIHEAAERGIAGSGGPLPHLDEIQRSFGGHDASGIRAHAGPAATEAAAAMGAEAFAMGNDVAFTGTPSLHTAAHEAAHVAQQRGGAQPNGGVGEEGDRFEKHADAVADLVVQGKPAEALLDQYAAPGGGADRTSEGQRKPAAHPSSHAVQRVIKYGGSPFFGLLGPDASATEALMKILREAAAANRVVLTEVKAEARRLLVSQDYDISHAADAARLLADLKEKLSPAGHQPESAGPGPSAAAPPPHAHSHDTHGLPEVDAQPPQVHPSGRDEKVGPAAEPAQHAEAPSGALPGLPPEFKVKFVGTPENAHAKAATAVLGRALSNLMKKSDDRLHAVLLAALRESFFDEHFSVWTIIGDSFKDGVSGRTAAGSADFENLTVAVGLTAGDLTLIAEGHENLVDLKAAGLESTIMHEVAHHALWVTYSNAGKPANGPEPLESGSYVEKMQHDAKNQAEFHKKFEPALAEFKNVPSRKDAPWLEDAQLEIWREKAKEIAKYGFPNEQIIELYSHAIEVWLDANMNDESRKRSMPLCYRLLSESLGDISKSTAKREQERRAAK